MSVAAVSMMANDLDVAPHAVAHLRAEGIDRIIVADHRSTDGTAGALRDMGVEVRHLDEDGYPQARVMNELIQEAGRGGASWVVPFDADEVWYAVSGRPLATELLELPALVMAAPAVVYEHVPFDSDDMTLDPLRRMVHRRPEPWGWPKVAVRANRRIAVSVGNHEVRIAGALSVRNNRVRQHHGVVGVRHFPWRTREQARAKFIWKVSVSPWGGHLPPGYDGQLDDDAMLEGWWLSVTDATGVIVDPAPVRG